MKKVIFLKVRYYQMHVSVAWECPPLKGNEAIMNKRAFTLIELLIVVAIIAILAAIAVPNFLEAQTRARVSRVQSDMRTLAVAVETYTVDNNRPLSALLNQPSVGATEFAGRSVFDPAMNDGISSRFIRLTTPIAYITSVLRDPFTFQSIERSAVWDVDTYDYFDAPSQDDVHDPDLRRGAGITSGAYWRLASVGPDRIMGLGGGYIGSTITVKGKTERAVLYGMDYDPTNGTTSLGDVVRVGGGPGPVYGPVTSDNTPSIDRVHNIYNELP